MNNNRLIKAILIIVIVLIPVSVVFIFGNSTISSQKTITSQNEMLNFIGKEAIKGKNNIKFKSSVSPDFLTYDDIHFNIKEKDVYMSFEIYSFTYVYKEDSNGLYNCKVHLNSPSRIHAKLAERKVKEIAKKASKLSSDYEKVKAVHDYLVLHNNFYILSGGSYRALYRKHSACTGYAYSFYAIMNELNIPTTIEHSPDHVWNRVKVGDYWYNMDVTWDDPAGGDYNYDYFLKCDKDFIDHAHGGANAKESLSVEGKSAEYYYYLLK